MKLRLNKPTLAQMQDDVRDIITKIWHWLTTTRICSWCQPKRILHRAPFQRQRTHTICRQCLAIEQRKLKLNRVRPLHPELTEPETPFTLSR